MAISERPLSAGWPGLVEEIESARQEVRSALEDAADRAYASEIATVSALSGHGLATAPGLTAARAALDEADFATPLFQLQEARHVAVAQGKLDELLEVRELNQIVSARAGGRIKRASERLARKVTKSLSTFPADVLSGSRGAEDDRAVPTRVLTSSPENAD